MPDGFFDEPEDQSLVKAEIVVDYFLAWSKIMARRADTIAYRTSTSTLVLEDTALERSQRPC